MSRPRPPVGRAQSSAWTRSPTRDDRGQTNVDFLFGFVVFIVTVGFVVAFLPSLVAPYADHAARPAVADRVADDLVRGTLAAPGDPTALDPSCTLAFFGSGSGGGCPFDASDALAGRLGVSSRYAFNVTVERRTAAGRTVACATAGDGVRPCSTGGTRLATGGDPDAQGETVVTAVRPARLDGTDVLVVVRVW